MDSESLVRVSRQNPCPVCGKPDWCGVSPDGAVCVCMRVSDGALKSTANGGYLHVLKAWPERPRRVPPARVVRAQCCRSNIDALADRYAAAVDGHELDRLAGNLCLSVASLRRLSVGWAADHRAWAFPMRRADLTVCGVRLRSASGRKWAVTGSRDGLFIPVAVTYADPLVVTEGPTDCAALLDLEFEAVGRPSCSGGVRHVVGLVRGRKPPAVVIVADCDGPGQRGAASLAQVLLPYVASVRLIHPPVGVKDARAWKKAGATHEDVIAAIEAATRGSLSICAGPLHTKARTVPHGR